MRAGYLDNLRGLAVVWMIIFHSAYDMRVLGLNAWDFNNGFWYAFPRVIAFTFLFCVGVSLNYSMKPRIRWKALGERSLKLGAAALAVSVATYFMFPDQWIYFGTLHCILVGSVLGALVVNHRGVAWALFGMILLGQYVLGYDIQWLSSILKRPSMDFIPIYPWFWAILAGILSQPFLARSKAIGSIPSWRPLALLGQHSLKIYLLHQPLIYGLLLGIKSLVA